VYLNSFKSLEKNLQFPIGFPIPQNKTDQMPPDFSKLVFLRGQNINTNNIKMHEVKVGLLVETEFINAIEAFASKYQLSTPKDFFYELNKIVATINPKVFANSYFEGYLGMSSSHINPNDRRVKLRYSEINIHAFNLFLKEEKIEPIKNLAFIRNHSEEIILNPNLDLSIPKYSNIAHIDVYISFQKWLHGNNRTI
jgi:hypothetical protein